MYTRALWFAEGVTSAYGDYTLERIGLWDKNQFYAISPEKSANSIPAPLIAGRASRRSSLNAWLESYEEYNRPIAASPITTKAKSSGACWTFRFARRPTITNRSTMYCAA